MTPVVFFKSLAETTRLLSLLLLEHEGELCVCELGYALDQSQPKISRHLALLKQDGLIQDRRQGQWVFYRIHPELAHWARGILRETRAAHPELLAPLLLRLQQMGERPERRQNCC